MLQAVGGGVRGKFRVEAPSWGPGARVQGEGRRAERGQGRGVRGTGYRAQTAHEVADRWSDAHGALAGLLVEMGFGLYAARRAALQVVAEGGGHHGGEDARLAEAVSFCLSSEGACMHTRMHACTPSTLPPPSPPPASSTLTLTPGHTLPTTTHHLSPVTLTLTPTRTLTLTLTLTLTSGADEPLLIPGSSDLLASSSPMPEGSLPSDSANAPRPGGLPPLMATPAKSSASQARPNRWEALLDADS